MNIIPISIFTKASLSGDIENCPNALNVAKAIKEEILKTIELIETHNSEDPIIFCCMHKGILLDVRYSQITKYVFNKLNKFLLFLEKKPKIEVLSDSYIANKLGLYSQAIDYMIKSDFLNKKELELCSDFQEKIKNYSLSVKELENLLCVIV